MAAYLAPDGVSRSGMLWPGRRVPYHISDSLLGSVVSNTIASAISVFNEQVDPETLVWTRRSESDVDYVEFTCSHKCCSSVGRKGGKQEIELTNLATVGDVLHEMGHAIGLVHEHSRIDSGLYVYINRSAIQDNQVHNFEQNGVPLGPYEYSSIMHYPSHAFSLDGVSATIVAPAAAEARQMNQQRDRFTKLDVNKIKSLYGPEKCTYELYGEVPWHQQWWECWICWGPDSDLGCCRFCAHAHHSGHDHFLIYRQWAQFVCDCGRNNHQPKVCTWHATKCDDKIKQPLYNCGECFGSKGIEVHLCYQCKRICHAGHQFKLESRNMGYCECRRKSQCKIPNPLCNDSCTYDTVGIACQAGYECRTCWGGESDYGCCLYCAFNCHKGHYLVYHPEEGATACDCGRNEHNRLVCTRYSTNRALKKQPFYSCSNCFSHNDEGCCYRCMKICHAGHDTSFTGIINAFCDCGLECCRKHCIIQRPLPKINLDPLIRYVYHNFPVNYFHYIRSQLLIIGLDTHPSQINVYAFIEQNDIDSMEF